jgi:hypothetical protein
MVLSASLLVLLLAEGDDELAPQGEPHPTDAVAADPAPGPVPAGAGAP